MKVKQAIEYVADNLIGKPLRTLGEDAAVVLYQELRIMKNPKNKYVKLKAVWPEDD